MRHVICLGLPVVGGTVLLATYASRKLLTALSFAGVASTINVAIASDESHEFDDLGHTCRLQIRRFLLRGDDLTPRRRRHPAVIAWFISGVIMGFALIIASLGFWLPAIAGIWLLAIRPWLVLHDGTHKFAWRPAESSSIAVRRVDHPGIHALRNVMVRSLQADLAYAEAYKLSVQLCIPEAADLYSRMLHTPQAAVFDADDGIWLPDRTHSLKSLGPVKAVDNYLTAHSGMDIEPLGLDIVDVDFHDPDDCEGQD